MLVVKNLSRYYGAVLALKNIHFALKEQEVVALLGLNGAGKTTTLRLLTGYLFPSEGSVFIDGVNLYQDLEKARQEIGYLPENPQLYQEMTVRSFLSYVYRMRRATRQGEEEAVLRALEKAKIADKSQEKIANLSAGLKKRVALAQALVHNPKLLILDEPLSDLDPLQIAEMRRLISELKKEHTILLSSHILKEVAQVADRFLFLRKGELVAEENWSSLQEKTQEQKLKLKISPKEANIRQIFANYPNLIRIEEDKEYFYLVFSSQGFSLEEVSQHLLKNQIAVLEMQTLKADLEEIFLRIAA